MKIRLGFVGNSSSSSFMIPKDKLSKAEIIAIRQHSDQLPDMEDDSYWSQNKSDAWNIYETKKAIIGTTGMDNFNMHHFLTETLGISEDIIQWDEEYSCHGEEEDDENEG